MPLGSSQKWKVKPSHWRQDTFWTENSEEESWDCPGSLLPKDQISKHWKKPCKKPSEKKKIYQYSQPAVKPVNKTVTKMYSESNQQACD